MHYYPILYKCYTIPIMLTCMIKNSQHLYYPIKVDTKID